MPILSSLSISYTDDSITAVLDDGTILTVDVLVELPDVTGEELAKAEHRANKLISGVLAANMRYLKSTNSVIELP
jgi:hypothetical protein